MRKKCSPLIKRQRPNDKPEGRVLGGGEQPLCQLQSSRSARLVDKVGKPKWWVWALLPILFALDRAAKIWADGALRARPGGMMPLIPGVIRFRLAENEGAAFSLFAGNQWLLLGVTSLIMLAVLLFILFGRGGALVNASLMMVLAGGLGNLYDRFAQGYVIDYLEFLFMRFAIFNLADVFVCVGAVLAAIALYRAELSKSHKDVESA